MSLDEGIDFFGTFMASGYGSSQQDPPDTFQCSQCDFSSTNRDHAAVHVKYANTPAQVVFTCPACEKKGFCLAVDLIGIEGHLDECLEAHKIGWQVGLGQYQHPATIQVLHDAMVAAKARPEGFGGLALIFITRSQLAVTLEEFENPATMAALLGALATRSVEGVAQDSVEPSQSPIGTVAMASGFDKDVNIRSVDEQQTPISISEVQGSNGMSGQTIEDTGSPHLSHNAGDMLPPGFEGRHERYRKGNAHLQSDGYYQPSALVPNPADASNALRAMENAEAEKHDDRSALGDLPASAAFSLTATKQASQMESMKPYLSANGSSAIDEFIRERGGPKHVDKTNVVFRDSDEETEEDTLANRSAWKPRIVQGEETRSGHAEQPDLGSAVGDGIRASAAASSPDDQSSGKENVVPITQPPDIKKKVAARRPRRKAPSMLQAMKAARAAKDAQEASLKAQQQSVLESSTPQQDMPQQAVAQQTAPSQTMAKQAVLQQAVLQQAAPQRKTPQKSGVTSKKRGTDTEPSAPEQPKRRRTGGEDQPAPRGTASRKVRVVAGPKLGLPPFSGPVGSKVRALSG